MKKVLYINGNPQSETVSFSRRVGKYYHEQMSKMDKSITIEVLNVYDEDIPFVDADVLDAWGTLRSGAGFSELSQSQQGKVGRMGEILKQFKEADEYVIVTPLWNLSIPPMLKAYIDNVMIAGETFRYTETGPVGLLDGKKATVVQASGGIYSSGPAAGMEHGASYIKTVLEFMGVTDIQTVLVEGIAIPDKSPEEKLIDGYKIVDELFEMEAV